MVRFDVRAFAVCLASAASALISSTDVYAARCVATATAPAAPHTINVATASYFGRGPSDALYAAEFSPDCTLLLGGRVTGGVNTFTDVANVGNPLSSIAAGSTGTVARLSTDGTALIARSIFGAQVNDLSVSKTTGDVAVASDVALAVVASDLQTVRWSVAGDATRVSITDDGRVAALFGKTLRVYSSAGAQVFATTFGDSLVGDVAIDGVNNLAFVTGFAQRNGSSCSQLQVAWIRAYELAASGTLRWRAYDYPTGVADQHNDCADTRGRFVTIGGDGKIYFAGTSAGGNAIYRWSPQARADINAHLPPAGAWPSAANVTPGDDNYVNAFNTRSNHITYVARFDPASGRHEMGFFLLSRLGAAVVVNANGNTIEPRAIAADEEGRVYVGGASAYQLKNRELATVNGTALAAYAGEDAWLLVTSRDYSKRDVWTAFNNGGKATIHGIAASGGAVAVAAAVSAAPFYIAPNALQATAPSAATIPVEKSGFFATMALPSAPATCWFDVDGDGLVSAQRDAIVLLRKMRNVASNNLLQRTGIASAQANTARTRATLAMSQQLLDIDGNGVVDLATDGVLLTRALLGFRDGALTANALGAPPVNGVWRNTPQAIVSYLQANCAL